MLARERDRLTRGAYLGQHWYFIMLNAEGGQPVFGEGHVVSLLLDTLRAACVKHAFNIYAYCFLPDHIHIEPVGITSTCDLIELMRTWKETSTVPLRGLGLIDPFPKGFDEYILRRDDNPDAVARYIFSNPVRKGLVKDARDWPYSGSWMFDWKKAAAPPEEFAPLRSGDITPPEGTPDL
jgi:putative transposase